MSNPTPSLVQNILSNYLGSGVRFAVALLLTPFLIHHLGRVAFGIWVLVNSFRQYFQLLELGTNPAIIKLVSEYAAKDQREKIQEVASSALMIFLGLGLLSIALSLGLALYGLDRFQIPSGYRPTARLLVILLGAHIPFLFLKRELNAILAGYQRFDLINRISIIGELFQAVMTVILLIQGFGLISLALLMGATNGLEILLLLYGLTRRYTVTMALSKASRKTIREVFGFSLYTFVTDMANRIAWNIDVLVIGYFLPVSSITGYTIGVKLASLPEKLLNPLVNTFFPLASAWDAQQQRSPLQRLMIEGTRGSLLLSLPVAALILFTGDSLISLWVGKEYLSSLPILEVFLGVFVVSNLESTASQVQLGMRRLRFNTIVCILSALANLVLSIAWIRDYGIVGVALGTLVPTLVANLVFSIPYTCSILELPLRRLLTQALIPPVASLLLPTVVVYGTSPYWKALPALFQVTLVSAVFFSLYFLAYLGLFSSPEERQMLFKGLRIGDRG